MTTAAVDPFDALAAYVRHDFDTYQSLAEQVEPARLAGALAATFAVAADQRFSDGTIADVIGFVAHMRQRFDDTGDEIDGYAAERLIRAMVWDQPQLAGGISEKTVGKVEAMLVGALLDGADDSQLSEVFATARQLSTGQ